MGLFCFEAQPLFGSICKFYLGAYAKKEFQPKGACAPSGERTGPNRVLVPQRGTSAPTG